MKFLSEGLPTITTDWSKWRFFFCDERIVSFENGESTYGLYRASLIGKVPITEDQFIKIDPDLTGTYFADKFPVLEDFGLRIAFGVFPQRRKQPRITLRKWRSTFHPTAYPGSTCCFSAWDPMAIPARCFPIIGYWRRPVCGSAR